MSAVYQDVKVAISPIKILKKIALFKFSRNTQSRNKLLKSIPRTNLTLGESYGVCAKQFFLKKLLQEGLLTKLVGVVKAEILI